MTPEQAEALEAFMLLLAEVIAEVEIEYAPRWHDTTSPEESFEYEP